MERGRGGIRLMVSSTGSRAWRRVRVWGLGKNVVRAERGERCRALG